MSELKKPTETGYWWAHDEQGYASRKGWRIVHVKEDDDGHFKTGKFEPPIDDFDQWVGPLPHPNPSPKGLERAGLIARDHRLKEHHRSARYSGQWLDGYRQAARDIELAIRAAKEKEDGR